MLIIRPLLAAAVFTLMVVSTSWPAFMRVEARLMKSGSTPASFHSAEPLDPTNNPPVAVADSYTVHASLAMSPKQNDYDPDAGDTISFQSIVTQPQHGVLNSNGGGNFIFVPTYGYVGPDSFAYSICDNHSACATGTASISIVNQTPIANSDSYTVHAGLELIPMQNDTDPEGDSLTFVGIATQPSHGVLNYNGYGKYIYTPTYGYVGSDSFTYTIKDSLGAVATGTVYINDVNQTPAANPDFYTVHASLELRPMLNDTDADGDSFSFMGIATQPSHGVLNYNGYGRYIYNPTYGYVGSDSFTYTIKDVLGAVATGTVYIDNVNQTPIANTDFYVLHAPLELIPMQNDSDLDADSFSFIGIATQPSHGSLAYNGYGKYIYTANSGYTGFDSFTYTIRDSLGASATGWVFVLALSQAPVAAAVPYACTCPFDGGGTGSDTNGGSDRDPVNLATGRESYTPVPDLTIYDPTGPRVTWQRSYIGNRALAEPSGYGSPGLSRGWVHNYDISIQGTSGSWGALKLIYANGASETVTPQLSGGVPTGSFTTVAGAPYTVSGISGTPTGTWQSVTVTWKDQTKWKFTLLSGTTYALTQLSNRTGQSLNLTWNSSRALTQIGDAGTSTILLTLAYGSNGKLATATDVYGRQVAYTFSAPTGTTEKMLQAVSQVVTSGTVNPPAHWTFGYAIDKGQQLSTIAVPSPTGSGNSTATINYDSIGKISSLVDANGNQRLYTYNSGTTQVQVKDSANNFALSWTQKFNSSGLDTGVIDAANHSTTVAYTSSTNPLKPTSVTDRNGHITTYTYDQFGNVLTVTSPRNVTTTYTWSYTSFALGRLTSIQEGSKPATILTYYEPSGLVQTITKPEPNNGAGTTTTTFTYDSLGNVLTIVRPGNDATTSITTTLNYTSDGGYSQAAKIGQPVTVTDNLGHATHLRYDAQGRATSVTDALGNETDFTYNLIGQSDTTTYPATGQTGSGHSHTTNAYLYVGGPLTTTTAFDESNTQVRQITRSYGLEGESLAVSGSTEPVTNTYDALYRVKTLKDGNNNTTTYAYNNIGLPSSITMPGSEVTQFTSYDNAGNLLQRIDGNNVTTNYVYNDAESLLTDIQYPASTSLNVHFTYDGYGRRSSMSDSTGSQSYSYGNLDESLSVITTYTGLSAKTISYAYYPDGSRQTMTTPAGTFTYSYDAGGRPASMTNPFSETTSWAYQNNNWLATQTLANGAVATYTHNALGQVTELLNQIGSTTISDFTVSYDGAGNRTSVSASSIGTSSLNGAAAFTYDTKNQLLEELSNRYGSFTDDFDFDSSGNPTTFRGIARTYNSNNQQTGTGFTYDSNGNPTAYNGVSLTFDPENRLTSHGSTLTAGYRGDGLRSSKQTTSGTTYFLYDGSNPVVEIDSSGSVIATNSFSARGLISRRVSSVSVLYTFDSEGNVAQRTDPSANVLSDHLFNAHGSSLNSSLTEPFGYKAQYGYYTDSETGLQLLTHRYYDPQTGRFLTRDPIGTAGGVNLYSYVGNNPANYADPNGLDAEALAPYAPILIPFAPQIAAGAAAAAPYAAAAAAYGGLLYGAWRFGEWTAAQPWNPFTHPADPFFPPLCPPMPLARPTPTTLAPPPPAPSDDDPCYKRYIEETGWCGRVYTDDYIYEQCMANAWRNFIRCRNGLPPNSFPAVR